MYLDSESDMFGFGFGFEFARIRTLHEPDMQSLNGKIEQNTKLFFLDSKLVPQCCPLK